ncbi:MAG: RsmD family RNA methyltransferase [Acidobacteriota bacterium]
MARRGRRLRGGPGVRPTEGRVREALVNIWRPRLDGARVLDLFAGTGAVGLALLDAGAASALLVDRTAAVVASLRERASGRGGEVRIRRLDLPAGLARLAPAHFDLIFADPPYAFESYGELLAAAAPLAAADARLAVEHRSSRDVEAVGGWLAVDRRRYGDCALSFFERVTEHSAPPH